MLDFIPISLLLGLVLGFLAALGVGGGSLLILWLTLVLNMEQDTARAINLLFFMAAAGSVCIFRWQKGSFDFRQVLPAIVSGCIAAGIFSFIGTRIPQDLLRKFFGVLLLATGLRELFYRPRNAK